MRDACYLARVDYDVDCLLIGDTRIAGKFGRDCCSVRANVCYRWGVGVQGNKPCGGVDTDERWSRDNSVCSVLDHH